jgi:hypothetical protein
MKAMKKEPKNTTSHAALSRHAKGAARANRLAVERIVTGLRRALPHKSAASIRLARGLYLQRQIPSSEFPF